MNFAGLEITELKATLCTQYGRLDIVFIEITAIFGNLLLNICYRMTIFVGLEIRVLFRCYDMRIFLFFQRINMTIILQRSVLLFLILRFASVRGSMFTTCLPFKTCEFSVIIETRDEKKQEFNPLYLTGKSGIYELAVPRAISDEEKSSDIMLFLSNKKKVIYACPKDQKNTPRGKTSSALVQQGDIKLSKSKRVDQCCSRKVEPTMKNLNTICHESPDNDDKFILYEIGFKVFTKHRSAADIFNKFIKFKDIERHTWQPLYQVCHKIDTRTTLYTIHTLYGESVYISPPKSHESFKDIDRIEPLDENASAETVDTKTVSMDDIFQKAAVQNLFRGIFGDAVESNYVNDSNEFLARGHLVPDADMIFIPWKNATYIYTNVVPMWQYINNSIWKSVENQIRNAARQGKKNYKIYTGVFDILRYNEEEIFLGGKDTKIMPVPLYLWKVVHYKNGQENKAMAFVVINDPYTKNGFLCPHMIDGQEICSTYRWPKFSAVIEDRKRKIMHCCTLDELRRKISYVPDLGDVEPLENPASI